jgi:hypothetical protein
MVSFSPEWSGDGRWQDVIPGNYHHESYDGG